MIQKYNITTREEYEYCRSRGIEPMRDRHFTMDIRLRRQLQREMFGKNTEKDNIKFYHYAWECCKAHVCEECGKPLWNYSSVYISHILTRGANADMAHDLRNFNLLCFEHHSQWETGDRKGMRIYKRNMETINQLHKDYGNKF